MSVGIVRILALVMDCRQPSRPAFRHPPRISPQQLHPLKRVQLPWKREHEPINNASVFTVFVFLIF
jgi:hypothetical protein